MTARLFLRSLCVLCALTGSALAAPLLAGAARVEITDRAAGPVNDPSFVKALVLKSGETVAVLITVDAVAIGEIGRIGSDYLAKVRAQLHSELGIPAASVIVNASHCHSIPRPDTDALTVQAVKEAWKNVVPVKAGAGVGREDRISENRRLRMTDGAEVDMRRAYSLPRDEDVAGVGPIDPRIGLLRLDREDGRPLAVLYHFACHPIMNPPGKGNSADFPGFASRTIEDALGGGALAFFIQGCAGDINPVRYKEPHRPADAEPLGTMLGASVLSALRGIETRPDAPLKVERASVSLPRAADYETRIASMEAEQAKLLASLKPTNLNFKSFLPLLLQHRLWPEYPSHHAQSYLHERSLGRDPIAAHDAEQRASVHAYLQNLATMEHLTRLATNLALLRKHRADPRIATQPTLDAAIAGLRVGDFKLVTFPGELTVEIGLGIQKAAADPHAFVAGYTDGYLYYLPTAAQRANAGYAQEDCDCLVAPEWQRLFETRALEILRNLQSAP